MEAEKSLNETGRVVVWDTPVRLFHWVLVALLVFSVATGKAGGNWMQYHLWSGYAILTLVLFRIVWGFVGSTYARFGDFLYGPRAMIEYAKTLPARQAAKFAGHNPLGAWSVLLLLACIALQAGTGLFANDDIVTEGPLYKWVSKDTSDFLTKIHHYNFNVLLALAGAHVAAVLYYLFYKAENLIKPMFTGVKSLPAGVGRPDARTASTALALLVVLAAALAVFLLVRKW